MKILITGATGSLGAYLVRHFSLAGHEIIASGQMETPPKKLLEYAKYLPVDITKTTTLPSADVCIHTAALSDDKASPTELYTPNVIGTEKIAKATASYKTFIQISSSSVYLPASKPITEDLAGNQNNKQLSKYGFSKLLAEELLLKTSQHEACFILRPRAFYGIGDKMILPRMFKLVKNDILQLPGKMEIEISMTHYKNIAEAIQLCINSDRKGINIYNVGDHKTYQLIDVMRKLTTSLYGKKLKEKAIPIGLLKTFAFFKIGGMTKLLIRAFTQDMSLDLSKIQKELNYKGSSDLDSSLDEIQEWVRHIGGVSVLKKADKSLAWKV